MNQRSESITETMSKISPETRELFEAMRNIVDYNWSDEMTDFEDCERNGNDQEGHVFLDLQLVDTFLRGIGLP